MEMRETQFVGVERYYRWGRNYSVFDDGYCIIVCAATFKLWKISTVDRKRVDELHVMRHAAMQLWYQECHFSSIPPRNFLFHWSFIHATFMKEC